MAGTLVYVTDPSRAPKGVALQKGSRGGIYYISKGKVGGGKVAAPKAAPKPKNGAAAKKPPPPPKRAPGGKFADENDPNLPGPVKLEAQDVRKAWVTAFNKTLTDGGSDADAMFEAKKVLPKRTADGKEKPAKRELGQAFAGGDDTNLPASVRAEAPPVRDAYARAFNDVLAKGGSEADASFAAKQTIPKRTVEPPKAPAKPKPVRRQVGQPFSGVDDPNLTMRVRTESTQVREDWVKTFNDTLKKNGSEADALSAANKKLPDRRPKSTTVVSSGRKIKEKAMETYVALDDDRFELIEIGGTAEKDDSGTVRGMVALYPGPEMAKLLAIDPGEFDNVAGIVFTPPEEMHVTIAYYPEIRLEQVNGLIQHVAVCAGNCWQEIETEIEGIAQFAAPDGEPVPYVILVDPTELMSLREMLCHSPLVSKDHGFIPHMTLAYVPDGQNLDIVIPPELPLTFDRISLLVDDQRYDFKLGMDLYGVATDEAVASYKDDDSLLVDSVSDDTEDPSQPHVVVSQTTGEGMDDQHSEEEALKAVWSTAFVNDLPDSAFLYVESGGKKDADGKTEPRSLRHFPYKGDDGKVDLPHLRNAIARIPQSNAPGLNKEALQKRAQSLLGGTSEKAGKRVAGGMREKIATALSTIKDVLNWANYEDEDDVPIDDSMKELQLDSRQQFVVFKDVSGKDRWLSRSSNAFMDREREIVSTKALEDVVAAADVSGDRGTLRIWHIPGSDIGDCDFQGVQGRMLIESGTFFDTPMAQAAKEFFQNSAEPLGVSVGFRYPLDSFDGQTYTKLSSIFERSVLPSARAANPWTDFTTIKEDRVDPKKAAFLEQAVGEGIARTVLAQAEEHTKSLEGTVAFKEAKELTLPELLTATKSLVEAQDSDEVKTTFAAFEAAVAPPSEDTTKKEDGGNAELLAAFKDLLQPIAAAVSKNTADNAELQAAVKELRDAKDKEDEASKESNAPRGVGVFRASSAATNVIADTEAVKEALGTKEAPASPVTPYIGDLIGSGRGNS